jgi:hypothetical protein
MGEARKIKPEIPKIAEFAMAKHTIVGKEEMEILEKQFMTLNLKNIEIKHYKNL